MISSQTVTFNLCVLFIEWCRQSNSVIFGVPKTNLRQIWYSFWYHLKSLENNYLLNYSQTLESLPIQLTFLEENVLCEGLVKYLKIYDDNRGCAR